MGGQKYALHSQTAFVLPRKTGHSPTYPPNPTHVNIFVSDQQYQNNLRDYHLFKSMISALSKIVVASIDYQCIKGVKYMVMAYANKSLVELMD